VAAGARASRVDPMVAAAQLSKAEPR
jgi:hypothetical protein